MDQATEPPPPPPSYEKRRLWYDEPRMVVLVGLMLVGVLGLLFCLVGTHFLQARAAIRGSDAKIANDTLRLQLERRALEFGSAAARGNAGPSVSVAPIVVLRDPSIAAPKTSEERRAAAASWAPAIAALADLTNTFAAAGLCTAGKLRDLTSTTVEELKKKGIDVGGNLFEHLGKTAIDGSKEHPKEDGNGATLPGQSSYSSGSVIVNCSTALMSRGARGQPEKDDPPGFKPSGGVTVASADDCRCQQQTALSTSQNNAPGTQ